MKKNSIKAIVSILSALGVVISTCVTVAVAFEPTVASVVQSEETTATTTATVCYTTQLEYDTTPIAVGEWVYIRVYHPESGKAAGCSIESVSDNIFVDYYEAAGVVRVAALKAGEARLYIREANCAFGAYAYLTIEASNDITDDGSTNMLDVLMLYQYVSGEIKLPMEERVTTKFYARADVNGDDDINILDVNKLYQMMAGTAAE